LRLFGKRTVEKYVKLVEGIGWWPVLRLEYFLTVVREQFSTS
jgi:hypothetical protein